MIWKKHIDLVIFDWAGTMVDFGCEAPVQALLEAFAAEGVQLDEAVARRDMGTCRRSWPIRPSPLHGIATMGAFPH
jgi:beta-phosphoglucomutase-like phosphatase (HAD superfamily)